MLQERRFSTDMLSESCYRRGELVWICRVRVGAEKRRVGADVRSGDALGFGRAVLTTSTGEKRVGRGGW